MTPERKAELRAELAECQSIMDDDETYAAVYEGELEEALDALDAAERERNTAIQQRDAMVRWLEVRGQDAANMIPFSIYAAAKKGDLAAVLAALGEPDGR